jgi:FixJ family two-component response regulator
VEKASASEVQARRDLIAVVDDDESVRNAVHGVLRSAGLKARTFGSAEEFLCSGQQAQIGCVISDMQMPGMTGLELLAQLATAEHHIPVIFITAYGSPRLREQARRAGAVQFLDKPFDDELLLQIVRAEIAT